jgi:hypothetical protein
MNLRNRLLQSAVCLLLAISLVISPAVGAAEIKPEDVVITTPTYKAQTDKFHPPLGMYEYSVKWEGIGAAKLFVSVDREGDKYKIATVARTNSFVDIFYKLRYAATGVLKAETLLPTETKISSKENHRIRKAKLEFLPNGNIKSLYWRKGRETEKREFDPGNFMLDPFSAAFLARSLDWKKGDSRKFDTYNGKSRYLIQLTAVDETTLKVNGKDRKVFVIEPRVRKLTEEKDSKKLRSAKIYVTADEKREILKIVSSVFVGSVTTKLEAYTPAVKQVDGPKIARAKQPPAQKIILR